MLKACADKLKLEMHDYGFPPVFPEASDEGDKPALDTEEVKIKDPSKGKKVNELLWINL